MIELRSVHLILRQLGITHRSSNHLFYLITQKPCTNNNHINPFTHTRTHTHAHPSKWRFSTHIRSVFCQFVRIHTWVFRFARSIRSIEFGQRRGYGLSRSRLARVDHGTFRRAGKKWSTTIGTWCDCQNTGELLSCHRSPPDWLGFLARNVIRPAIP